MSAVIRPSRSYHKTLLHLFPFLRWGRQVTRRTLRDDFLAGLTGAIVALPQGVAFALIAGLPPEYGLHTAIVTSIIASLFGSSRHLISGPTIAISIVTLSVVTGFVTTDSPEYISYVLTLTFMAGLFQFLLGLARMGTLVNFISHTVVIGFTSGAAVLIASHQLKHFFGIPISQGGPFLHTLMAFFQELGLINGFSLLVALATLLTCLVVRRYWPRWPNMFLGIIAGSIICWLMNGQNHGVSMLGSLPGQLPPLSSPDFSINTFRQLASGALAVAMLGLIGAVSIARSVATRSHQLIDGNQEFIGQGLSNMLGSFLSCYAGSGSFTRSGINYEAGAKTPLAAVFASLILAMTLVFLAPLTAYLPMPAMAGVIMLVAWNLINIQHIRLIAKTSKRETVVLVVTFLSTLLLAMEFAIYTGVLLSLVMYLQRTSRPTIISLAPDSSMPKRKLSDTTKHTLLECPQLKIIRLDGSLFFGAVDHVQSNLHRLAEQHVEWKHVLIIGSSINFIDVAGAEMLAQEARRMRQKGGGLYLCGVKSSVHKLLKRGGYEEIIGRENIFSTKEKAIRSIFQRLDLDRCRLCQRRIFRECATVKFEGKGVMG